VSPGLLCSWKTRFGFSKPDLGFQNPIWVFKTQFGFSKPDLGFQNPIWVFKTQFGFSKPDLGFQTRALHLTTPLHKTKQTEA
jgi:hypothetical protein